MKASLDTMKTALRILDPLVRTVYRESISSLAEAIPAAMAFSFVLNVVLRSRSLDKLLALSL